VNVKLKQQLLLGVLAAGLVLAPIPGLQGKAAAASPAANATSSQSSVISVFVDGVKLRLDPGPMVVNGTTLVPMRALFTALHAEVSWEPQTKMILASKDRIKIALQVGATQAVKNGKTIKLSAPVRQAGGATYVPLRFVAEALGANVELDAKTNIIRITSVERLLAQQEQANETDPDDDDYEYEQVSSEPLATKEIVDLNDERVVMITTNRAQGSGVVIGDNWILTNYHVMRDATKATVATLDGDALTVNGLVGYDEKADLAIIETKQSIGIQPVALGHGYDVRKGDHVVAIGSPLGLQNTVSEGVISNISYDGAQIFQISVPIDHGSSGGGLFNDSGELIGVTTSGIDQTNANLNFAVSVLNVNELIRSISGQASKPAAFLPKRLPESLVGVSTDDIRILVQREFGTISAAGKRTELKNWKVTRDDSGWLELSATIDPGFYMVYGHSGADDLRYWAIDAGTELKRMLPDQKIRLVVYYEQTFSYEPRNLKPDEVKALGDGTWQVRYPVIDMQTKDKMHVQVRS